MSDVRNGSKAAKIRELNDRFRSTFCGGQVYLTSGVAAFEPPLKAQVLEAVRTFKDFDEGNDPHAEHDFVSLEVGEEKILAKIDCYDIDMRYLSDDPGDAKITKRVMTIMLASEY